jgi:hypothetical protein
VVLARTSPVALALAAALALSACGGDSSSSSERAATTAAVATTPAATTPATTTTPATAASGDTASSPDVSSAGDTLALGKRVVAPYTVYASEIGGKEQHTKLGVTVLRVRKGKISDFKDFNLDTKQKQTVPYYVDTKIENLGQLNLQRFLLDPSIEDADGQEYKPINLIILSGTFTKCPQPSKRKLHAGESFTLCAPILLPKGKTYERVRFQGDVTQDPYFWR